ncbi:MAG: D-sedoheptulose 7-phosphate isomerase [Bacteroidota bacterium]|nr:D-sedoheptulose 7-phosphate isomerase [Bacteroidota bacterium]
MEDKIRSIKEKISDTIAESITVKTRMLSGSIKSIKSCGEILADVSKSGKKIFFCGNGGSAADSQHLAAELVVRLRGDINRRALPAIALTVDTSVITACGNDYSFDDIFARALEGYGAEGDALVAISTSGNSANVIKAISQAKKMGISVIGLLGKDGGKIYPMCDDSVVIPSDITARIQECHIMVGHIWCEIIEEELFPELFPSN